MQNADLKSPMIKPIILCGGSGTRLWPLSRSSSPKQFVPLVNNKSLLELTLERVKKLNSPMLIANEEHRFFIKDLLQNSAITTKNNPNILLEPDGRNTSAAMGCAALMPGIIDSDLLLFLPSDHFIPDVDAFISTVLSGVSVAELGYIVTFGIRPAFPSSAYGYIHKGSKLQGISESYLVKCFVEKPQIDRAKEMILSDNHLWNAGIFLCKASVLLNALSKHAPDIYESCKAAMKEAKIDGEFIRPKTDKFLACRSESIDYSVMENFDKVAVVPFAGAWSDVGSWNAVADLTPSDYYGNRIVGNGFSFKSSNTYIQAPNKVVVALGTSDLIIVDTPDALLVANVEKVEEVKNVVLKLKEVGLPQVENHKRVYRPWGWYDSIDAGERFQVKRISVKPGASLSLQMHYHRAEHWIVVKGVAKITNGNQIFTLKENQSTFIPIGVKHRLENPGYDELEIIEVQSGVYLGEDDIVRFEDTYGRINNVS